MIKWVRRGWEHVKSQYEGVTSYVLTHRHCSLVLIIHYKSLPISTTGDTINIYTYTYSPKYQWSVCLVSKHSCTLGIQYRLHSDVTRHRSNTWYQYLFTVRGVLIPYLNTSDSRGPSCKYYEYFLRFILSWLDYYLILQN